ncbi:MAG: cytochrome c [Vicinamibacterales bacterium]
MRFISGVCVSVSVWLAAVPLAQSSGARSVRDGVYTATQADRGGSVYEEKCTSCHASRMWGSDWPEKSVWDIYDTISNFMPADNPGSLTPQQYRDVVAYILKTNKLPAGAAELPESAEELRNIRLDAPAP